MRLLRFGAPGEERPAGVDGDGTVRDLSGVLGDIDGRFLATGGLSEARRALDSGTLPAIGRADDRDVHLDGAVRVGAPIARPGKIVCIGLNYRDHAAETGAPIPQEPILFMKASNTMAGPYDKISVPRGSVKTDWEVELGVVIGQVARYLRSPEEAASVVAGYVVVDDVSEREFQLERGGQWDKGKSCETFNPTGPWLVPARDVPDPQALGLRCWVNGVRRQNGSTADMVFDVHYLVWYLSQFMVLEPGDLIDTGTPAGVSLGHDDVPYLAAGDVVEVEADGLGRQRCELVQA